MTSSRILVVTGPTASGKTRLSIPLARRLGGEVISMDSRQVYRGMDVGTDKASPEERAEVPHHGLDLVDPQERYSAGQWAREARAWIAEIRGRGALPIVVGGTGFFLRALIEPIFREPPVDPRRRERLRGWLATRSADELARWARRLDPDRASLAEAGGSQRLSRTVEIPLLTGHPLTWWHRHAPPDLPPTAAGVVLVTLPRTTLYRRIDERAERMFREDGLLAEVRGLLDRGVSPEDPGMTGTGYREAAAVLRGECTLAEAIDRVQRATRRYARRQLVWFRNQLPGEGVFELDGSLPLEERVRSVERWWLRTGGADGG